MSLQLQWPRIGLLMSAVALYLGIMAARTEVIYADGLRYIAQARSIEEGSWRGVLTRAEDHPAYPMAIALVHRLRGGNRPIDWQAAAQTASVTAAVLLVIPLYLLAMELFGSTVAWVSCVLTFLVPVTGQVLADGLSEGTFLLFWTAGCWCSVRFLRAGSTRWLLGALVLAGMAYLVRPEGLLLPVALAGLLPLTAMLPSLRMRGAEGWRAWAVLVFVPLLVMGPLILMKGGLGTKPAVARLLGLAPPSATMAVERERPLNPDQSRLETVGMAVRGVARAVIGAVPWPVLALALIGIVSAARDVQNRRALLFLALILAAWLLALVRLHYTSGYCTPRHALIAALPLIAFAARGLFALAARLSAIFPQARPQRIQSGVLSAYLALCLVMSIGSLKSAINHGFSGYRQAGDWISSHTADNDRVLDLKGWGLFYGGRSGYSFANLQAASSDPQLRWVVAHDSLLVGPWAYCDLVRQVVNGRQPVVSFPEKRQKGVAQVHIFRLQDQVGRKSGPADPSIRR